MSEMPEEQLTNVSLMNIMAAAILVSDNHLEVPIELALSDFGSQQISLSFDEDRKVLILELVEYGEETDESGQTSEESA